jgi:hypothetical protein
MPLKVDYYTSLARAVAGLDRDSYAARGAVYDSEHKALMRHLYSSDPPLSDAEIGAEQRAFREAVRRVEFGEDDHQLSLVPERSASQSPLEVVAPAPAPAPPPPPRRAEHDWNAERPAESHRRPLRDPPQWSQRKPSQAAQIESAMEAALDLHREVPGPADPREDTDQPAMEPKRRSVIGRVLSRALLAVVLLGVGIVGYDLATGDVGLPGLKNILGGRATLALPSNPKPQRVILFDGARPDLNGSKFDGQAFWRLRTEGAGRETAAVVQLDLNVPGRKVALSMTMRREPASSAMSHLIELRFLREDQQPDADIANIAGIVMTSADMTRPTTLVGQLVNVAPGVFLFGLSGQASEREKNLRTLKEFPWIGIPISYRNGASGVLTFEKGADGEQVIDEALSRWAPRS